MADKKDLAEAQRYSRRRLVTAFTSGIPSDVELVPRKNQIPVIVGVCLTLIAILIGVFHGYMRPSLPANWRNNKLIVARNSAARYVSVNGRLHPVINATSARLLIPSSEFEVIIVDDNQLAGIPIDTTLGILGAPDSLPASGDLVSGALSSCTYQNRLLNRFTGEQPRAENRAAIVARTDGVDYLITGTRRYKLPVDIQHRDGFLRAYGVPQTAQIDAPVQWINLFKSGSDMNAIRIGDPAQQPPAGTVRPGSIVMQQNDPSAARYLVMPDGSISQLDEVSYNLYAIGKSGAELAPVMLSSSDFQQLKNSGTSPLPADWPTGTLMPARSDTAMCATLPLRADGDAYLHMDRNAVDSFPPTPAPNAADAISSVRTTFQAGSGALLRASIGSGDSGTVFVIDSTGTAYPLPENQRETLTRLGYSPEHVCNVPRSWVYIFPTGATLTTQAAGRQPGAATNVGQQSDAAQGTP